MSAVEDGVSQASAARRHALDARDAEDAAARLRDTSIALLEANQRLARIPLLEHRAEEIWAAREWLASQNEELRAENDALRAEVEALRGQNEKLRA
jgi:cell division protein FtsB